MKEPNPVSGQRGVLRRCPRPETRALHSETPRPAAAQTAYQKGAARVPGVWLLLSACVTAGCTFKLPQTVLLNDKPDSGGSVPAATTAPVQSAVQPSGDSGTDRDGAAPSAVPSTAESQTATSAPLASSNTVPEASSSATADPMSPDGGGVPPCGNGETDCRGSCVPAGTCECTETCGFDNAEGVCDDGVCHIKRCMANYVDCDGDPGNGCEFAMNAVTPTETTLNVRRLNYSGDISGIGTADWTQHETFAIAETCRGCGASQPHHTEPILPVANQGTLPSTHDLSASVKFAWNDAGFWVRLFVYDDAWFLAADRSSYPIPAVSQMLSAEEQAFNTDPRNFDNGELYWDNDGPNTFPEPEDHGLFFASDGSASELLLTTQSTHRLSVTHTDVGPACRITYLQLTPAFLANNDADPSGLESGQSFGFNLAVNDYDLNTNSDAQTEAQHQGQLFLFKMDSDATAAYFADPGLQLGRVTLTD